MSALDLPATATARLAAGQHAAYNMCSRPRASRVFNRPRASDMLPVGLPVRDCTLSVTTPLSHIAVALCILVPLSNFRRVRQLIHTHTQLAPVSRT